MSGHKNTCEVMHGGGVCSCGGVRVNDEKAHHQSQRDQLARLFASRPHDLIRHEELEALVGRNYQQRISEVRRQLRLNIENVPRRDPLTLKLLSGDYRYRPNVLGREAADFVPGDPEAGTLFDLHPSGWKAR